MKKMWFVMVVALLLCTMVASAGLLPKSNELYGEQLPSLELVIGRAPTSDEMVDNDRILIFEGVSYLEYGLFGAYLSSWDCSLISYEISDYMLTATIACKELGNIYFTYDGNIAIVKYPKGTRPEIILATENMGENILPDARSFLLQLPSLTEALGRSPNEETENENGYMMQRFYDFGENEYGQFSQYLLEKNCKIIGSTINNNALYIDMTWNGEEFAFIYDYNLSQADMIYKGKGMPAVTPSPTPTATPEPTATPTPAPKPTRYRLSVGWCYDKAVSYLKDSLKNPASLQIHGYTYDETNNNEYCIVIDYSAQNGFGGYNREKYFVWVDYYTGMINMAWGK